MLCDCIACIYSIFVHGSPEPTMRLKGVRFFYAFHLLPIRQSASNSFASVTISRLSFTNSMVTCSRLYRAFIAFFSVKFWRSTLTTSSYSTPIVLYCALKADSLSMNTRLFSSTTNTLNGFPRSTFLMKAALVVAPDFSNFDRNTSFSDASNRTTYLYAAGLIFGGRPPWLNFCFIKNGFNGIGWKLPTAGFENGDDDFGVRPTYHIARVSGHNLIYECPGTYLAMFQ